jgi:hypothetical protein
VALRFLPVKTSNATPLIRHTVFTTVLAVAMWCAVASAMAQPRSASPPVVSHPPAACAPGERLTPRDLRSDTPVTPGETLSDKLARTEGVLCPPHVDPEMAEQPPGGGALRVIPPPGSSPADPVRPK